MAKKSNKNKKNIEKALKKINKLTLFCVAVVFILGACAGAFTLRHLTKNDYFKLNGEEQITLLVNAPYTDEGAKAVAFGKDVSDKIEVIGLEDVDTSEANTYVIKYKINNFRFKNYTLYRQIIVVEEEEVNNG